MADAIEEFDDEEYFAAIDDDAELTGKEPKFVKLDQLGKTMADLQSMRVDELILLYRQARDQLATDRKGYKTRDEQIKFHLSIISTVLADKAQMAGVESMATVNGTAFKKIKEFFRVGAWDSIVDYMKSTGNFHIVQKRLSSVALKEIREVDGALPPGVDYHSEIEFSVRAPTARKSK